MRGYPRRYVVYDTETRSTPLHGVPGGQELVFRLGAGLWCETERDGGAIDQWFEFHHPDEFHSILEVMPRTDEPIYVFAHNHGFDSRIVGFFRELALGRYSLMPPPGVRRRGQFKQPLFVIEDLPFLVRLWRADGQQLFLCDLHNWVDTSLDRIAGWLGLRYVPLPRDGDPDDSWMTRCRNDVAITAAALRRLWVIWRELGGAHWQPTLAAGAMTLWRARYNRRRLKPPEDQSVLELDRHAFYGGRNEPFELGEIKGPVWQVDVSSMYPYVMGANLFPCEVIEHGIATEEPAPGAPPFPKQTTAEVYLDSADQAYPVRCATGTAYCVGRIRTILAGPELDSAVKAGHVVRTGRWARYRMTGLFGNWVADLWGRRMRAKEERDLVVDWICKALMNSLYGKFGQRAGSWIFHDHDYPPDTYFQGVRVGATPEETVEARVIAGRYATRSIDALTKGSFVPVAAFTTAYARVLMDWLRAIAGQENVYYQQIDSLLVNANGFHNLHRSGCIQEGSLGKLRVEGVYEWIDIRGVNQLIRDRESIPQGIPRGAVPLGPQTWEYPRWEGPWMGICRTRVSSVSIRPTSTTWRSTYHGSHVHENGRCAPWNISNWHLSPERQRELPLPLTRKLGSENPGASDDGASD